jgi:hypothetical protein
MLNPIFVPSPMEPRYSNHLIFEGISVDENGKQHYLDVNVAYRPPGLPQCDRVYEEIRIHGRASVCDLGHSTNRGTYQ